MSTETEVKGEAKPLTHIYLRKFCGTGMQFKFDDSRPLVKAGFCWATDGVVLVRIPYGGPDSVPRPGERPYPDTTVPWTGKSTPPAGGFQADGEFVTLLPDPAIQSTGCWVCGGDRRTVCSECDDESRCQCCCGVGTVYWPQTMKIGTAKIQTRYHELIHELPNPTFVIPGPGEEENAISFRFDGGEGLLRPVKADKADDA